VETLDTGVEPPFESGSLLPFGQEQNETFVTTSAG